MEGWFEGFGPIWAKRSPHDPKACFVAGEPISAFLNGVGTDFESLHHEVHEPFPAFKVQIGGEGFEVLKEPAPRSDLVANQPVVFIGQFQQGVQPKGQQVHRHQQGGEMLFAVAEVMFQMIAPVLEHVVILVFDLPAGPPGGHQSCHVVSADGPVGDIAVAVKHRPFGVGDGQLAPVEHQRVGSLGQGHAIGPLVVVMLPAVAPAFDPLLQGVQTLALLQALDPFGEV